ncbi:class I SAM-dependent methyltransferase [Embleya scabrispora]|uniref:class I SAM-dependent methyltransferase n=1 Tax=Embleya scabrispora TaxID=159449 RepID=UPI0003779CD2|nr:class I SAM-dependent methyltransferase [Embleya scabrispora]MYS87549.1 methyltransferase domain-containing protein [Streptomyces sp. SID5474]
MTSAATDHYERLLAENYTWMLGGELMPIVAGQAELLTELGVAPTATSGISVDLGCGPGNQSLALAGLGFTRVLAVDTSRVLLAELAEHAAGLPAIEPVHQDIRTVLPGLTAPGEVAAVVCMGDTLTHLPSKADVIALLGDIAKALVPGGRLVVTYRDLTETLHGIDRFIPVRSTADRVLTCFLEYPDADTVLVYDLLHIHDGTAWTQHVDSYSKLRIAPTWLADRCREVGLSLERNECGSDSLRVPAARKE